MDQKTFQTGTQIYELRGSLSGWHISFREEIRTENLYVIHFELNAETETAPPELKVAFRHPQRDIQVRWTPECPATHHLFQYWWNGGQIRSSLCCNAPVFSYFNLEGENRLTYAVSDASGTVLVHTGPTEQSYIINEIVLYRDAAPPVRQIKFSLLTDRRPIHYSESLRGVSDWYAENPAYLPAPVPEAARRPFYSTWYQFQRDVSASLVEKEFEAAVSCNLKAVILDDGWNYSGKTEPGTFAHAGDWAAAPEKFSDMPAHIRKAHALGMRYLLWFPVPFTGSLAKHDYSRFQGKFLNADSTVCGILDPRFPEVREYLVSLYEKFVGEWDLDGLKLDFIDSFSFTGDDPALKDNYAGRDIHSLPEAVETLLAEIIARLKRLKPEILIEFRQKYIGPAIRRYGNIFRAGDCAMDLLENRVRTLDLRLLSGNTAVHSDMLIWSPEDTPEIAALQILNVIFSTPQISCTLTELPAEHLRMLAFWMDFCIRHSKTLQESPLYPEHPELSYPLVTAKGDEEAVTAVYKTGEVVPVLPNLRHIILNAKHTGELLIDAEAPGTFRIFNVFGEPAGETAFPCGLSRVPVPPSGFAVCGE